MNGRIVLVSVLNAIVAVALAALLVVLIAVPGPPAADGPAAGPVEERGSGQSTAPGRGTSAAPEPDAELGALEQVDPGRLKRDLMDREDLIPFEGRLGGTMDFYTADAIEILSDRWVYARFDDGHVQGGMLLEYAVGADGEINWRVIEARME